MEERMRTRYDNTTSGIQYNHKMYLRCASNVLIMSSMSINFVNHVVCVNFVNRVM